MNCPECQNTMKEKRWITSHWFGDLVIYEILWWVVLFPLTLLGVIGWGILIVILASVAILSHGKRWYKCRHCGHSMMVENE